MATISLFPVINPLLLEEINFTLRNIRFYSNRKINGKLAKNEYELAVDFVEGSEIVIKDETNLWDIYYDDLSIDFHFKMENIDKLFGKDGIAPSCSTLGIGIRWYSRGSKKRGVEKIYTFTKDAEVIETNHRLNFQEKTMRESLNSEFIIYIDEPSNDVKHNELHLANEKGIVLGVLYTQTFVLEGSSSAFPVQTVRNGDGALWDLHCGWEDLYDEFNDNVWIRINEEHSNFKYLEVTNKAFNQQLLDEIMISTVFLLISTIKERGQFSHLMEDESFPNGSVGYLVRYYLDTFEISTESSVDMYSSINKELR